MPSRLLSSTLFSASSLHPRDSKRPLWNRDHKVVGFLVYTSCTHSEPYSSPRTIPDERGTNIFLMHPPWSNSPPFPSPSATFFHFHGDPFAKIPYKRYVEVIFEINVTLTGEKRNVGFLCRSKRWDERHKDGWINAWITRYQLWYLTKEERRVKKRRFVPRTIIVFQGFPKYGLWMLAARSMSRIGMHRGARWR